MLARDFEFCHQVKARSKFEMITQDVYIESVQSQK